MSDDDDFVDLDDLDMAAWMRLGPDQQLRVVGTYLGERGVDRAVKHGRYKERAMPIQQLTQADIEKLRANRPAHPTGQPDDRWTAAELRAWIDHHDAQIAASAPQPLPKLDLERLSSSQRRRVAACQNQAEYERVAAQILTGEQFEPTRPSTKKRS
jgi:hypothetical protein